MFAWISNALESIFQRNMVYSLETKSYENRKQLLTSANWTFLLSNKHMCWFFFKNINDHFYRFPSSQFKINYPIPPRRVLHNLQEAIIEELIYCYHHRQFGMRRYTCHNKGNKSCVECIHSNTPFERNQKKWRIGEGGSMIGGEM